MGSNYGKITLRSFLVRVMFQELASKGVAFAPLEVTKAVDEKIASNGLDPNERKTEEEWRTLIS